MRQMLWKTLAGSLIYLLVAVGCLVQPNRNHTWIRFDWFVISYFALRLAGSLHSVFSSLTAFRSSQLREEWWALNSDPAGPRWVMLLMVLDLSVFLDYGHWHYSPVLLQPALRAFGTAAYVAVTVGQIWTDSYLAGYFNKNQTPLIPMNEGPYRCVRHPRYGAAIVGKVAMAFIFGSVFGWVLALAWGGLLVKKIEVEERHLRKLFGVKYETYALNTAKVLPGVY